MERREREVGAVVGSAVGDALGAPFEFGPPGALSARFPGSGGAASAQANEMCGGGGWDPGEATDDTQMAILVAESLLTRDGFDPPDMFTRSSGGPAPSRRTSVCRRRPCSPVD